MSPVRAGFTLLELLVVLAIAAAVAALAGPRALSGGAGAIEGLAPRVAAALEDGRRAALLTGMPQTIALVAGGGALRVADTTIDLPAGADVGLASDRLIFFPDGSTSGATIVLSTGGRGTRVVVSSLTGRIGFERLEPGP